MSLRPPSYQPPVSPTHHRYPQRVYWRRRVIVLLGLATVIVFLYLGVTLAMALSNPSLGVSYSARAAEWGRSNGLGGVVTWFEKEYYKLHPPKKGGRPPAGAFGSGSTGSGPESKFALPVPTRVPSPAGAWLPGEGVWHPAGRTTANGVPAIYESYVRPDKIHTSYVVGLAWMDPHLLQAQLYSGSAIPGGGPYKYTAPIKSSASTSLVAAFNAGFRMPDANGGYYTQGKMVLPLRNGAASVVTYKDGTMTVAKWGRDATMSNQVASVRQNLDLIVDNGKLVPGLNNPNAISWGKTLGGTFNVWRSGIGVTKNGALVYAAGSTLSIYDLAHVLQLAGAVRAMELDINTDWVQYSTFTGPLGKAVNGGNGKSLVSTMLGTPSRYFVNYWNRDFYTMSLRSQFMTATTTTTAKSKG